MRFGFRANGALGFKDLGDSGLRLLGEEGLGLGPTSRREFPMEAHMRGMYGS